MEDLKMTVRELIDLLENCDDDMEVRIGMQQTYGTDFAMEINSVGTHTVNSFYDEDYRAVVITEGEQCGSVDYDDECEGLNMYYYDVVASICSETCRTDSRLIYGGFATKEEAMDYINEHDVYEEDYYWLCNEDEAAYIEIEVHDTLSGGICDVITVD
jgi:hypothetical protein